jgi:hypothetical protein
MDFAGARDACSSILAVPEQPGQLFGRHLPLTLMGAAEAGLGHHQLALERLTSARHQLDGHVALLDWYSRLWQRWALTNVRLSIGDLAGAREEAELLVANAMATAERTWQGLAWDALARAAAQRAVAGGLAAIWDADVPVAAWQVRATAAHVAAARGDAPEADVHSQASRQIVLRLAASLGPDGDHRVIFLTAPAVTRVLRGD